MGIVISTHLPPPVMIDNTDVLKWVTHMLCWTWAMYFSAAAGDERQHRRPQVGDPHVVLDLGHVLFGRRLLGERPWQHELGFEDGSRRLHGAVKGRHHPANGRVPDAALDVGDPLPSVALV